MKFIVNTVILCCFHFVGSVTLCVRVELCNVYVFVRELNENIGLFFKNNHKLEEEFRN